MSPGASFPALLQAFFTDRLQRQRNASAHTIAGYRDSFRLQQHGIDRSVIALWLGHESVETTQMYLHADLRLKQEALSKTTPIGVKSGWYRPGDKLLAFLESI